MNLSSFAGRTGFALRAPYAAGKWGVIGLTKSLTIELGEAGIRVNAILPGLVAGDRQRRVLEAKAQSRGQSCADVEAEVSRPSPLGRFVSGQSLSVCGDTRMIA